MDVNRSLECGQTRKADAGPDVPMGQTHSRSRRAEAPRSNKLGEDNNGRTQSSWEPADAIRDGERQTRGTWTEGSLSIMYQVRTS